MKKTFVLSCLLAFGLLLANAQDEPDKSQMEKEREEIQKEIKDLQNVYTKIKGQKNVTLGQANLIRRKIELQEKYLNRIKPQLQLKS